MNQSLVKEFLKAGVHFGHVKSRRHPKMMPFIHGRKDKVHIINVNKTIEAVQKAYSEIRQYAEEGKKIVFVGTKKVARPILNKIHDEYQIPIINERWLGGFMTNFATVSKSITRMKSMERDLADESLFAKKKEKVVLSKKLQRLERFFKGVADLGAIPDLLVLIDPLEEKNAAKEARDLGVKTIGIVDTNTDPAIVDLCIPANTEGVCSLGFLVGILARAYQEGAVAGERKRIDLAAQVDRNKGESGQEVSEVAVEQSVSVGSEVIKKMTEGKAQEFTSSKGKKKASAPSHKKNQIATDEKAKIVSNSKNNEENKPPVVETKATSSVEAVGASSEASSATEEPVVADADISASSEASSATEEPVVAGADISASSEVVSAKEDSVENASVPSDEVAPVVEEKVVQEEASSSEEKPAEGADEEKSSE